MGETVIGIDFFQMSQQDPSDFKNGSAGHVNCRVFGVDHQFAFHILPMGAGVADHAIASTGLLGQPGGFFQDANDVVVFDLGRMFRPHHDGKDGAIGRQGIDRVGGGQKLRVAKEVGISFCEAPAGGDGKIR